MSVQSLFDMIFEEYRDVQSTRYSELASSAIIIYDHIITLDDEINLIWKARWSMGKILFILNRYYGLFTVIFNNYGLFSPTVTNSFCNVFFQWQGWTGLIACILAEVILQMRLYALFLFDKRILASMLVGFIFGTAGAAYVMGSVLTGLTITSHPVPGVTFCTPFTISSHFYTFWIPMLTFETFLCGLALFRGFQTYKSRDSPFRSGRHLVDILVRDSVLYFVVMFATYLTNLLIFLTARNSLLEIPIGFSVAMSCVMGNRIVLNVRDVTHRPETNGSKKESSFVVGSPSASRRPGSFLVPPDTLTEVEKLELRMMRAEHSSSQYVMV